MESVSIFTKQPVDRSALQRFVASRGGYWAEEVDQGVIEEGEEARIYVSLDSFDEYANEEDEDDRERDMFERISQYLRAAPSSAVGLSFTPGIPDNAALVERIANEAAAHWDGCVYVHPVLVDFWSGRLGVLRPRKP